MRVLFAVRPHLEQYPGGDTTQILATARELRTAGVEVDLLTEIPPSFGPWDVVHLFHLDRLWENLRWVRALRGEVPVVLSPIWWPKDAYNAHARQGAQGFVARRVGPHAFDSLRVAPRSLLAFAERPSPATRPRPAEWRFRPAVRELLGAATVVLPNSEAEQRVLETCFRVTVPYRVARNGVDVDVDPPAERPGRAGLDVLCVGQFTPRKNQHKLIEAVRGTDVSVTFVGGAGQFSRRYEGACRRSSGPNVRFLGHVPHDQMAALYRDARVHVLPSWFETPGLSSLEAAAHGCPIVVGESPPVREYFGDLATYCDPASTGSIREALLAARRQPADPRLADMVRERCSWAGAAAVTRRAYEDAVGSHTGDGDGTTMAGAAVRRRR
jgi:glycosyltransferase involved in cell wall biosynthesis